MSNYLPSRFFGTIFHITYSRGDKKSNEPTSAILMTNKDSFYILSADWRQNLCQVSGTSVTGIARNGNGIHITYKVDGRTNDIFLESNKVDKLISAITIESSGNALPPLYNSVPKLIPTFKFQMDSEREDLIKNMDTVFNKFFSSFECTKPYAITFTDLLIAFYRFRFPQEQANSSAGNIDTIITELNRQYVEEWLKSIGSSAEFDPAQTNGYEYALRLTLNLANDLYLHQNMIETNANDLFQACAEMSERRDASKITPAVISLLTSIKEMNDKGNQALPPTNNMMCVMAKRMLILAFCGNMVQILTLDIERITTRFLDFCIAVYNNQLIEENWHLLRKSVDSFSHELLKFMDTRRYDPSFRFVYACHVVAREIIHMKVV